MSREGWLPHETMVRVKGLEPPRQRRQNLNLVRLPIPPHPHEPSGLDAVLPNHAPAGESKKCGTLSGCCPILATT